MYLDSGDKSTCYGCEACVQACAHSALSMQEDAEGFRYPVLDAASCVRCGRCRDVCPYERPSARNPVPRYAFGGYSLNPEIRFESTSGGAFSAIADAFCDENYVIFGAMAKGLLVFHGYITDKSQLGKFRKSKYSQSIMGLCYRQAKKFLKEGKKVLFSGTPCQIAGLKAFLGDTPQERLLTVEVVCEGVPSPLYVRKLEQHLQKRYGKAIESLDYRYTGKTLFSHGKLDFQIEKISIGGKRKRQNVLGGRWDFETMKITLKKCKITLKKDRWFNPFWSIWLNHLMSRPSCYHCPFACQERVADISLGDLWGVHIYCPELYGNNGGSSLIVCNSEKGRQVMEQAKQSLFGHELNFEDALKYQSPMRGVISENPNRAAFMSDLASDMDYTALNRKWAKKPTVKLLIQKYVWGNRRKVFVWNLKRKLLAIVKGKS